LADCRSVSAFFTKRFPLILAYLPGIPEAAFFASLNFII